MTERAYDRAEIVQQMLTETGKQQVGWPSGPADRRDSRAASISTVLCDDRDFEVVASVTGQPVKLVTDV